MQINDSDVKNKLKAFVVSNFMLGKALADFRDGTSFLDAGIVDSTGVLEIVGYLQDTWGIDVPDEELLPENLDSVDSLVAYVQKKLEARS